MKTTAYTPFEVGARDRMVGIFVIVAVLLFLLGFVLPRINQLGRDTGVAFYTSLDKTYGIAADAPVSMHGVAIGHVTDIAITDEGGVRIGISLQADYRSFYREGSQLQLDSNLAVSTLLSGTGLVFQPGPKGAAPLAAGVTIETLAPADLSSIIEQLSDPRMVVQLVAIIDHIENLTAGLSRNQVKVYDSLDSLKTITANVTEVTRGFPALLASIEHSLAELERTMASVAGIAANADKPLQQTLGNTVAMTDEATQSLAALKLMLQQSEPSVAQLPVVMATLDATLNSVTRLSEQLQRSWLLGGGNVDGYEPAAAASGYSPHPHDDSLYAPAASESASH